MRLAFQRVGRPAAAPTGRVRPPANVTPLAPIILAILLGQSNMDGRAAREAGVDVDPGGNIYQIGNYPAEASTFQKIISDITPLLNREGHNGGGEDRDAYVGPGEYILRRLSANNPNAKVVALNCSVGGTTLLNDGSNGATGGQWFPESPANGARGGLYREAIERANAAIPILQAAFPGRPIEIKLYWVQGEFDAQPFISENLYLNTLLTLIDGMRAGITGAASAPFIIGSMVPQAWIPEAPYPSADKQKITRAHIRATMARTGVFFSRGPDSPTDSLHYAPADKVREQGYRLVDIELDTTPPVFTGNAALASTVGQKLAYPVTGTSNDEFFTVEIMPGKDASAFELSDILISPKLRWVGDGTGPAVGTYEVDLRLRDGAGNLSAVRTYTATVGNAYGTGDQGPTGVALTGVYSATGNNFFDDFTVEGVQLKTGLNIFGIFSGGSGKPTGCLVSGANGDLVYAPADNGNGGMVSFVSPIDVVADVKVLLDGQYTNNSQIIVGVLNGTKKPALSAVFDPNSNFRNSPLVGPTTTCPTGGIIVAFGEMYGAKTPNTGTTVMSAGSKFIAFRKTSGAIQLTGDNNYSQLTTIVWEKSV